MIDSESKDYSFDFGSKLVDFKIAEGEVKVLPKEFVEAAHRELLQRTTERRSVEVLLKRGFQFNVKEKKLVIPLALIQQDSIIRQIILSCADMLSYEVVVYVDEKIHCGLKNGFEDFFLGLLYSIGGPRNTRLSHSKIGRELAFAIGMSLRCKGEALRWNVEGALKPNNFFFANNPQESVLINKRRVEISYGVKNAFLMPFESAVAGAIFYKVVSSTLMQIGIQDMEPQIGDTFFLNNLISFDDFVKKNWVEVFSEEKRGKQQVLTQVRKATFPSRNAMLLNEELEAFKMFTSPFFSSVEDLRKDYTHLLMTSGYSGFNSLVAQRFGIRHTILQNIAGVTTKRLQGLRKALNQADLKKKQVTREKLITYLSGIPSPLLSFKGELEKLLNSEQRQIATSILGAELGIDNINVIDYLVNKIAVCYVNNKVYTEEESNIQRRVFKPDEELIRLYELCHKKQISLKRLGALIISIAGKVVKSETPEYRGVLYQKMFTLSETYLQKFEDMKSVMNDRYQVLVKNLAPVAKMLDTVLPVEFERNGWVSVFCRDFLKEFKKTSMKKTLDKNDDSSILAFIKKTVETGKSQLVLNFN